MLPAKNSDLKVCLAALSQVDHFSSGHLSTPESLLYIRLVPEDYTGLFVVLQSAD